MTKKAEQLKERISKLSRRDRYTLGRQLVQEAYLDALIEKGERGPFHPVPDTLEEFKQLIHDRK